MSSELVVKIQRIHSIKPHPNADKLEIACIGSEGGWETCVKKNVFTQGQLVVYIPPDTLVPKTLHEALGITNYCEELSQGLPEAQEGYRRVKAARLRGEKSFGTLMTMDDLGNYMWDNCGGMLLSDIPHGDGDSVIDALGVKKWIPVEKIGAGEAAKPCSWLHKYTDIKNIKNFPDVFVAGEEVVMTEKIHGTNCRVGIAKTLEPSERHPLSILPALPDTMEWMAGSHETQRRQFMPDGKKSLYWMPLDNQYLVDAIYQLTTSISGVFSIVVFGEIYGPGIQDMTYGVNKKSFRIFDIAINGKYLDYEKLEYICMSAGLEMVPLVYRGPFSLEVLEQATDGPTLMAEASALTCKFKGREGVVVKPIVEREHGSLGRVILKSVSADYLGRKNPIDNA